jgi:hypothetical protein
MTAFVHAPLKPDVDEWWDRVGLLPETSHEDRRAGTKHQSAQYEGGLLTLIVMPGRIEWGFAVPEVDFAHDELGMLGQHLEPFRQIVRSWLKDCPALSRLAFGGILRFPVDSREKGYGLISNYLNFDLDPRSFDFTYQINRPRQSFSVATGLKINRLVRWSIARTMRVSLTEDRVTHEPQNSFFRLELDMNTEAERVEPIPAQLLLQLYDELIDLGKEIVREGDVA